MTIYSQKKKLKIGNRRVLEEIITLQGRCMDAVNRCNVCPFASECLQIWHTDKLPTAQNRVNMALDKIADMELLDD